MEVQVGYMVLLSLAAYTVYSMVANTMGLQSFINIVFYITTLVVFLIFVSSVLVWRIKSKSVY